MVLQESVSLQQAKTAPAVALYQNMAVADTQLLMLLLASLAVPQCCCCCPAAGRFLCI